MTFDKPPSNPIPQVSPRPSPLERDDAKIWSMASNLIPQHGNKAAQEALRRANEMLDRGDRGQQVTWLRVRMAVLLQQTGEASRDADE
jgi:hypothetical protein